MRQGEARGGEEAIISQFIPVARGSQRRTMPLCPCSCVVGASTSEQEAEGARGCERERGTEREHVFRMRRLAGIIVRSENRRSDNRRNAVTPAPRDPSVHDTPGDTPDNPRAGDIVARLIAGPRRSRVIPNYTNLSPICLRGTSRNSRDSRENTKIR